MSETRLTLQSHPCTAALQVQGLPGISDPATIHLRSNNGRWDIRLPADQFTGVSASPGEVLVASITLFRAAVEPVPEPFTNLNPPLILPKAN